MSTVTIFGRTFEHISIIRGIGNPVIAYLVQTDEGWYIHPAGTEANVYKTVTSIYETDNFDEIIIIPESELPEDAVILDIKPDTEVAGDNSDNEVS